MTAIKPESQEQACEIICAAIANGFSYNDFFDGGDSYYSDNVFIIVNDETVMFSYSSHGHDLITADEFYSKYPAYLYLSQQNADQHDALLCCLPFIEEAAKDPTYRERRVIKLLNKIRAIISFN